MSELQFRAQQPAHIWHNNPVLVQLLGLSPLLAVSTSMVNGLTLGLATAFVLLLASITVAACQRLLKWEWRFVFYLFVLAVFTTLIDMLLQRWFYALHRELGIYLPLICCNLALLVQLDSQSRHRSWTGSLYAAFTTGCGYLLVLVAFAALRELLIQGQIGSNWSLLIPNAAPQDSSSTAGNTSDWFHFGRLAPAALILLGLLLALKNLLQPHLPQLTEQGQVHPATRARVTGKIQTS